MGEFINWMDPNKEYEGVGKLICVPTQRLHGVLLNELVGGGVSFFSYIYMKDMRKNGGPYWT
tara:strand:+ start:2214 stop:2399 length:186 start_codon:yes stop_codon:yes gene_type:complete